MRLLVVKLDWLMNQQSKKIMLLTSATELPEVLIPKAFGVGDNKRIILITMIRIFSK